MIRDCMNASIVTSVPRISATRAIVVLMLLMASALTTSCGDQRFKKTYPVKGQVLFQGKAAKGAAVTLRPLSTEDHPWTKPSAEVDENGEFTVTTYKAGDGAPAGEYAVTIVWLPPGYAGPLEKGNKLPARYADPATSGLKIEVKAADNVLEPFLLTK
jgi:hypothetical protein